MVKRLEEAKVPVKPIKMNPAKRQQVTPALQALLSKSLELKEMAQRALVAYVKSVHMMGDKEIFRVPELPLADYALSLGLASVPRLRFLKGGQGPRGGLAGDSSGAEDEGEGSSSEEEGSRGGES